MARFPALCVLFAIGAAVVGETAEPPRPNIIQIMTDDLGWGAVGYNGQEHVQTPNIDQLARGGMVFHRAYAAPVCSPTRASLQVGFHTGHTWTDRNIRWPAKGFREQSVTIGDVLQAAGYTTGAFGKWGFGGSKGEGEILHRNPVIDNPTTVPTNQGYDRFYGCLDHVRAHTYFMDSLWEDAPGEPHGLKLTPTGNTPEAPFTRFCDDLYAEQAEEYLRTQAGESDPFYLQMHYQTPHSPLEQIERVDRWFDAYAEIDTEEWSDAAKQYAAMVTRMDASIGRLLDLLRDPNEDGNRSDSILDDTLVLFTSDNGGYRSGFAERFETNGGLRGGKGDLYEGGIRVPMVAYWPGTIEAGRESHRPVDITDQLPTFADLAAQPAPLGIDGVSFAPTLTDQGRQRPRPYLAFEDREDWAIIKGHMKLAYFDRNGGRFELYDLKQDPGEEANLLAEEDAARRDHYLALKEELERVAAEEGVRHGDAIGRAWARENGRDRGEPYYVTYHRWEGEEGADLADPAHWVGKSGPKEAWIANIDNNRRERRTAVLNSEITVLGLEVRGSPGEQILQVRPNGVLSARNEVRVSKGGFLELADGRVQTSRRVAIRSGGELSGSGHVAGTIENQGRIRSAGALVIEGDVHQGRRGVLQIDRRSSDEGPIKIAGALHANGRLVVEKPDTEARNRTEPVKLVDADSIRGRFAEHDLPPLPNGKQWDLPHFYETGVLRARR